MYFKRKVSSTDKMSNCAVILVSSLLLTVSTVKGNGPKFKSSGIYPRSINVPRDRGGGGGGYVGNPADWTMSKANLVAEFYSSEPAPNSRDRLDRSQKNLFSFLMGNTNNGSTLRNSYGPPSQSTLPQRMAPPPLPPPSSTQGNSGKNGNVNLIASGTTYNHQALPFNEFNGNTNIRQGGYSSPFVPINYPVPQQNFIKFPGSSQNGPNLRPPNGPSPTRQFVWGNRGPMINGLRPPPASPPQQQQQQQYQPPPPLYLPPQQQQQQPSPSSPPQPQQQEQPPSSSPTQQQYHQQQYQPPSSLYLPPQEPPPQPFPRPEAQYQPQSLPRPQIQPSPPVQQVNTNPQSLPNNQVSPKPQQATQESKNSSNFTPSALYLPPNRSPKNKPPPEFQPGPPPPQILDTYSKQSVYPPTSSTQPSTEKPLVYVLANSSFDQTSTSNRNPSPTSQHKFNGNPLNSYTQYENEPIPPPPVPSSTASSPPPKQYSPTVPTHQQQYSPPVQVYHQQQNQPSPQTHNQQQNQPSPQIHNQQQNKPSPQILNQQQNQPSPQIHNQQQNQPSPQIHNQQQNQPSQQLPNLNGLALTEPLSHVLAEANAKAGDAMDKTIRFVIHKPEDEDIVKNAILENAQQRYEDVRFVQGPTLKVQRKETVYLPPKKKTVVYILLKEPQIDTDVEVMSPQEEDPVPEVYITYQKSDGATKTKHYSPKPVRQEDMKKYLDIEEDPYTSGEETRITPRFSKSTSVSLSTSSKISRKTASMSSSVSNSSNNHYHNNLSSPSFLLNHRMSPLPENDNGTGESSPSEIQNSPLLYTSSSELNRFPTITNSTSSVRYPQKKPRSSDTVGISRSPRRFIRQYPIDCPTVK